MSYQSEVLADSPVAYFRLSEPSGTNANDLGSGNNDGTYANTPTLGVTGPILSDGSDTAVTFTATSSQRVEIPDLGTTYDVTTTFSLEAWVKIGATGGNSHAIISLGQFMPYMRVNPSGNINLLASQTTDMGTSNVTVNDNGWHHVVWTKSGTTNLIYIDSVDRTGSITNVTFEDPALGITIGADLNTVPVYSEHMNGSIDEVALYTTALSSARVTAHFNAAAAAGASQRFMWMP